MNIQNCLKGVVENTINKTHKTDVYEKMEKNKKKSFYANMLKVILNRSECE